MDEDDFYIDATQCTSEQIEALSKMPIKVKTFPSPAHELLEKMKAEQQAASTIWQLIRTGVKAEPD